MTSLSRPPQVLVVDDNPAMTEQLTELLPLYDIDVVGAVHAGEEVLPAMRRSSVDVVVMDVRMPDSRVDGLEATRLVREAWPRVAVILHTAFAGQLADRPQAAGAFAEVAKGAHPLELVHTIRHAHQAVTAVHPATAPPAVTGSGGG